MSLEQELRQIAREESNQVVFPDVQKVEITNLEDIDTIVDLEEVSEALQSILSVLKKEDKPLDLTGMESKLQSILEALSKEVETSDDIDYSDVLNAIQQSIPTSFDYNEFFDRLEKSLEDKLNITSQFREALKGFHSSGWLPVVQSLESGNARTTIQGVKDDGANQTINATAEGHLEVAIHGPLLPFGSVHTEKMTPVFQTDAVYGINAQQMKSTTGLSVGTGSGSGTNTAANNMFKSATGTTQYSFAALQSRRRLRYRPGQGFVGRFAGYFSEPVANSIVVAGFGHAESGYFFGYNGTSFGILHSTGGVRELHTFTITTASTATNDYVVTLPNGGTVNVTATNNGSTTQTAYEISKGTFPGWEAEARGSTVIFLAGSAGPKSGSFSLAQTGAATPAAGSDVETTAGVAATDTWTPQANFNLDTLDGTGPSTFILDPQKGNVFQIDMQYLGFGSIVFYVETYSSGKNNPLLTPVHIIKNPNTLTVPHMSNPSLPFTMAAYSAGSTTDVSVNIGSIGGFIEGDIVRIGPRSTPYMTASVTSSTSAYIPLFTIKNSLSFASRVNQSVANIISVHGAAKSNQGLTTYYLIKDAALTGPVNYQAFSSTSALYWDKAATGCTFSSNSQIQWAGTVSESGNLNYELGDKEITMQPGESYTLAVRSVTATAVCLGSMNMREDQ